MKLLKIFSEIKFKALFFFSILFCFLTSSCEFHMPKKTKHSSIEFLNDVNQESMLRQANFFLKSGNVLAATDVLESIRVVHPFSDASKWAMLNLLKIYQSQKKYTEMILVANQFLEQVDQGDPEIENVAFLYADAHFYKMGKKARDLEDIKDSIEVFSWFLSEFGENSKYSKEIKNKMQIANGRLIFRELEIGNFYEKKRNFIPALKRYLDAYSVSSDNIYSSEILYRIYYCYLNLGLFEDADVFYQKLITNYKNDKFAKLAMELNYTLGPRKQNLKK